MGITFILGMVLFGCSQDGLYSLEAAPIEGADAREEAAIRSEIQRIVDTMQVQGLLFEAIVVKARAGGEGPLGHYDHGRARIELPGIVDDTMLQQALVHQVCHAMDTQFGDLSVQRAEPLIDVYRDLVDADLSYPLRSQRHSEGFAQLCALGAGPLAALASDGERPSSSTRVASWVTQQAVLAAPARPDMTTWLPPEPIDGRPSFNVYGEGVLSVYNLDTDEVLLLDIDGNELPGHEGESTESLLDTSGFDARPFAGDILVGATSASRGAVAFVRPAGGSRFHVFARDVEGPWAWVAPMPNPFLHRQLDGEMVFASEPEPGVFQVHRLP